MHPTLLKQLNLWHNRNKYKEIISTILELPEEGRDYELVCHLGRALNNEDRYNEAIAYFLSVQDEGAADPLWHYRLGYAYYYSGKYEAAVAAFEHALELEPDDQDSQMLLNWSRNAVNKEALGSDSADQIRGEKREVNDEELAPFKLVSHDNGSLSLILSVGSYKSHIFEARADEGFEGNGYDWASLAAVFLDEKMPELVSIINFDPEAGMFAAYTSNQEAMVSFAAAFKEACENDALIGDLFSRAELD
ncbi:Imm51 family immunity protein [Paenibacillus luteus]|uniref:Imm51 family immunity protein n=1 Tax=Paenibacillus luteus TaxID=2545753 RepID=UPI0011411431|nr:Imm51 family immunity protein [Paenibacillus luteus]